MPKNQQNPGRLKTLIALLLLLVVMEFITPPLMEKAFDTNRQTVYGAEVQTLFTLDGVENALYQSLYNRDEGLNIRYVGDTRRLEAELPLILEAILQKDDYLRHSLRSWRWRWSGVPGDIKLNFLFDHLTSSDEDIYVREEITRILNRILTPGMDNHQKVKAIHDYVVATVAYDTTYQEFSAYGALARGKAVCQGYALLTYKMLHKAGVESLIITGIAAGENHAWNMVHLDGNWYHLDTTWNSPLPNVPGRVLYAYYNRTDAAMRATHAWEQDAYPTAPTPYRIPTGMQFNAAIITAYAGEKWPSRADQPPDKMWTIRFNQPINPATVNNRNIFVADRDANLHMVRVHAGDDGRSAYIVPAQNYPAGATLYLLIARDLLSREGRELAGAAWMEFSIVSH